jgi:hypothetical protein
MDGKLYVEILNDDLLGSLDDLEINKRDVYFQQDNDPKHTSGVATDWFRRKKVDTLSWPPSSPDMNIIENIWDYLERRVCTRDCLLMNSKEMWGALQEEWMGIEMDYITKLFESMPCRIEALLEAKGGYTKY